jgi:transcriptional regulator
MYTTGKHESERPDPWSIDDKPASYMASQLKGIVGFRIPITSWDAKSKMSQNRNEADRRGVVDGLKLSHRASDQEVAKLIRCCE